MKNVENLAYSEPLIREIAEKQITLVIGNRKRIMFHISENNIHCGYSFEWPWPDDSNKYVQNMLHLRKLSYNYHRTPTLPVYLNHHQ